MCLVGSSAALTPGISTGTTRALVCFGAPRSALGHSREGGGTDTDPTLQHNTKKDGHIS